MSTDTAAKTITLPATGVQLPAAFPWTLGKYTEHKNIGLNGDARSLELTRGKKMVVLAKNDGNGGESQLEVWSRGDEAVWDREQDALAEVFTALKAQGLQYRLDLSPFSGREGHVIVEDYTEASLADTLLQEAGTVAFLAKKRAPYFAESWEKIREGEYRTFSNTTGAAPELIQSLLDKHPGWLYWNKAARTWSTTAL